MNAPRSGGPLIRATKAFAAEDATQTWVLFGKTVIIAICFGYFAATARFGYLNYVGSVLLGLINLRLFIFYHDTQHGSIFRDSKFGKYLMNLYGFFILTPPQIWRDSHNYHHTHTSKLVGSSIGSFPLLTVHMYQGAKPWQRFLYRGTRHWLTMLLGYFTIFFVGMGLEPLFSTRRRFFSSLLSLILHFGLMAALFFGGGFDLALRMLILPMLISCAIGSYLFYVQHTFPGMELRDRRKWEYTTAALRSTSMLETGPLLTWFTGNIGYHHVHHLNARIPFYRLDETMNAIPELKDPIKTSFHPKDIWDCLRIHLWHPQAKRMLSYREAKRLQFTNLASQE